MGHDAGQFAFGARGFNHSAIDVHRPARQGEGIDVAGIDDFKVIAKLGMLELGWNRSHQSLPDSFDIRVDVGITQQRKLLFSFSRCLPAQFHIIGRFVFVTVITDWRLRNSCQRHRDDG